MPRPRPARPEAGRGRWLLAPVLAVTCLAYLPVLQNGFTSWDDPQYVLANPLVRSLANVPQIFREFVLGNYHPLTMLSYALEYPVAGENPFLYHLDNLLLHLVNTALVFFLVRGLTGRVPAAAAAAMLFGVHPLNVESVAWISERKGLLVTGFFLASLVGYVRYVTGLRSRSGFAPGGLGDPLLRLSLLGYLLALLSKSTAVSLPVVLLLIDWFLRRPLRRSLKEKIPFFALSVVFGVVALFAQDSANAIRTEDYSPVYRLAAAGTAILTYLGRLVFPVQQSCFYPYPTLGGGMATAAFYAAPLAVGLLAVGIYRLRNRLLGFGALFFLITVALVLQILPVGHAITADRYSYLPFVGWFLVAGSAGAALVERRRNLRLPAAVVFVAVVVTFSVLTHRRAQVWRSSLTLWTDVIEKQPQDPIGYANRGAVHLQAQRYDEAAADLDRALALDPDHRNALLNRGAVHHNQGAWDRAMADYTRSIERSPGFAPGYLSRGKLHYDRGDYEAAVRDLTAAITRDAGLANAYHFRAVSYENLGRAAEALRDAERAKALGANVPDAYLGVLRARAGAERAGAVTR